MRYVSGPQKCITSDDAFFKNGRYSSITQPIKQNIARGTSSSSKHSNAHLVWQHLQDVTWVMRVTEQTAPLLCLVCYESSMIKLPLSADKRSVSFSLVLSLTISEGNCSTDPNSVHSTPLWLVVNREVKGHRSNFTIRPGRSRAPDNTRCWNSGGRKSWDTNRWTHTYRHLQRCTGKHKIVSLSSWMSQGSASQIKAVNLHNLSNHGQSHWIVIIK